MAITPVARVSVDLHMGNGNVITLSEGDIVRGLKYKQGSSVLTIDGTVRVIIATTKSNSGGPTTCPPDPYLKDYITVSSVIIDSSSEFDAELTTIKVNNILGVGTIEEDGGAIDAGVGPQYKPLVDVIADAPAGSVVKLSGGTYDATMTLNKDITLVGEGNVEMVGALNIAKGDDGVAPKVQIEGVSLTDKAVVQMTAVEEFTLRGCTIGGFAPEKSTQPIHFTPASADTPVLVTIEDCVFTANNDQCYNLINIYAPFKDGSSISRNRFELGCSTHNIISLFAVEDGATLTFSDNYCEYTPGMNMLHVQIPGDPKCTIIMENNTYVEHPDADPKWAGLFLVQPNTDKTVTYENVTIHCDNTVMPEGATQLAYIYMHKNNTQLTKEQYPVIYVDGVVTEVPVYAPTPEELGTVTA